MEANPKCPKCEKEITEFAVRHAIVGQRAAPEPAAGANATTPPGFLSVLMCCPHCMVIISAVAEPNAIAADVVRRLVRGGLDQRAAGPGRMGPVRTSATPKER